MEESWIPGDMTVSCREFLWGNVAAVLGTSRIPRNDFDIFVF